jgi:hypothetical protein
MAGPMDDDEHTPPQSPCTKGIVQALVRKVKKHIEGIDADAQGTNERIGVLEATRLATDTKNGTMEDCATEDCGVFSQHVSMSPFST